MPAPTRPTTGLFPPPNYSVAIEERAGIRFHRAIHITTGWLSPRLWVTYDSALRDAVVHYYTEMAEQVAA